MPDVSGLSNFLIAGSDIKDGEKMVIQNAGEIVTFNQGKANEKRNLQVKVRTENGVEKIWTLNKTSHTNLMGAWGPKTEKWVGKTVMVAIGVANVQGTMRKIIYAEPASEEDQIVELT